MNTAWSRVNPSNFRIDRLGKFVSLLWPWTFAVFKGSLLIGVFEIDDSQRYVLYFEKTSDLA